MDATRFFQSRMRLFVIVTPLAFALVGTTPTAAGSPVPGAVQTMTQTTQGITNPAQAAQTVAGARPATAAQPATRPTGAAAQVTTGGTTTGQQATKPPAQTTGPVKGAVPVASAVTAPAVNAAQPGAQTQAVTQVAGAAAPPAAHGAAPAKPSAPPVQQPAIPGQPVAQAGTQTTAPVTAAVIPPAAHGIQTVTQEPIVQQAVTGTQPVVQTVTQADAPVPTAATPSLGYGAQSVVQAAPIVQQVDTTVSSVARSGNQVAAPAVTVAAPITHGVVAIAPPVTQPAPAVAASVPQPTTSTESAAPPPLVSTPVAVPASAASQPPLPLSRDKTAGNEDALPAPPVPSTMESAPVNTGSDGGPGLETPIALPSIANDPPLNVVPMILAVSTTTLDFARINRAEQRLPDLAPANRAALPSASAITAPQSVASVSTGTVPQLTAIAVPDPPWSCQDGLLVDPRFGVPVGLPCPAAGTIGVQSGVAGLPPSQAPKDAATPLAIPVQVIRGLIVGVPQTGFARWAASYSQSGEPFVIGALLLLAGTVVRWRGRRLVPAQ